MTSMGKEQHPLDKGDGGSATMATTNSWTTFTENTTFHGIKYIFESTPFRARRVLWALCVLTAVTMFTFQVCSRGLVFFEYKANVDVDIVYADKVQFPAVTVCNQNNFRLTKTVSLGLYDFIDTIYSIGHSNAELDELQYGANTMDAEEFVLTVAHQREDFIEKCSWRGKPCNIADDFETKITDVGVCYTFNSGRNSTVLEVEEPGTAFGLSLIVNLEQFEYMKGPQNEAGIKILLHDHQEPPLMRNHGFAVAPGTHTLVGIHRTVIRGLEPPYGVCSELASPMAVCVTECKTKQVVVLCGCRGPYMANLTDVPSEFCNMTTHFGCLQEAYENAQTSSAGCECPVPCRRVNYEPSLSYAQLSKYSIERIVLPSQSRRQKVKEQFLLARGLSQRWVKEIVEADNELMGGILNASHQLQMQLHTARVHMGSTKSLANIYRVADVFQHGIYSMYDDDMNMVGHVYGWDSYISYTWALDRIPISLDGVLKMMDITEQNSGSGLVIRIENCSTNSSGSDNCDELLSNVQTSAHELTIDQLFDADFDGTVPATELRRTQPKYEEIHADIFDDSHVSPDDFPEHGECLKKLALLVNVTAPAAEQVLLLAKNLTKLSTGDELFVITKEIENIVFLADLQSAPEGIQKVLSDCNWVSRYAYDYVTDEEENRKTYQRLYEERNFWERLPLEADFGVLSWQLEKLEAIYERKIPSVVDYCKSYLSGNLTKAELAQNVSIFVLEKAMADFSDELSSYNIKARKFTSGVFTFGQQQREWYRLLYLRRIPPFNDRSLREFSLWRDLLQPSPALDDLLTAYREDRPAKLDAMLEMIFEPFVDYPAQTVTQFVSGVAELTARIRELIESLQEYTAGSRMNAQFYMDNFLQVDIFYKDVSYEKVEQHAAFEFLSLLSEVGGFLGLLLGASVLTVCELVDYLTLAFIRRCRLQKPGEEHQSNISI